MKIEIELPEVPGYEYTGEYRAPNSDDWFLDGTGKPYQYQTSNYEGRPPFPILKKKAPVYKIMGTEDGIGVFVEIRALKDIMELAFIHPDDMTSRQCAQWTSLQELIK